MSLGTRCRQRAPCIPDPPSRSARRRRCRCRRCRRETAGAGREPRCRQRGCRIQGLPGSRSARRRRCRCRRCRRGTGRGRRVGLGVVRDAGAPWVCREVGQPVTVVVAAVVARDGGGGGGELSASMLSVTLAHPGSAGKSTLPSRSLSVPSSQARSSGGGSGGPSPTRDHRSLPDRRADRWASARHRCRLRSRPPPLRRHELGAPKPWTGPRKPPGSRRTGRWPPTRTGRRRRTLRGPPRWTLPDGRWATRRRRRCPRRSARQPRRSPSRRAVGRDDAT